MRNPKLVLVLNSDSHSKNASVGPLYNPWPIQLYHILIHTANNKYPNANNANKNLDEIEHKK